MILDHLGIAAYANNLGAEQSQLARYKGQLAAQCFNNQFGQANANALAALTQYRPPPETEAAKTKPETITDTEKLLLLCD